MVGGAPLSKTFLALVKNVLGVARRLELDFETRPTMICHKFNDSSRATAWNIIPNTNKFEMHLSLCSYFVLLHSMVLFIASPIIDNSQ